MKAVFRPAALPDLPAIVRMVDALYAEDPSPQRPDSGHTRLTFNEFERHPEKGGIWVFEQEGNAAGYAILVWFWSNEYGGNKIVIDEIYVLPEYRGKGISTAFFQFLTAHFAASAVALELEVTPGNAAARRLYERLGFRKAKNDYFVKRI